MTHNVPLEATSPCVFYASALTIYNYEGYNVEFYEFLRHLRYTWSHCLEPFD